MTDPDTADRTYVGPMTPELVESIIAKARAFCAGACDNFSCRTNAYQEKPDALLPTMGGQTALNLAVALAEARTESQCLSPLLSPFLCRRVCWSATARS